VNSAHRNQGIEAAEAARPEITEFCRRNHVRRLALFGSVLRADFRQGSDIDILVEFEKDSTPGFFAFVGMKEELSELLGRTVDLRTPLSLSPYFREQVLREAIPLHDAA
jgi:predicted nucleotidyltransferase